MKIVTIIGARPQFIKAGAVSRAITDHNAQTPAVSIEEVIVHTGQHYDANMSQIFFDELHIPRPHYNLEVGSGNHGAMTGAMLAKIEDVLITERPDFVMVYGDTNSTLSGAVAAVKLHIPAVHVEAGLRSYNRYMPEEINRIIADQTSNILLCPSQVGVDNLKKEGVGTQAAQDKPLDFNTQQVYQVGDVMYDSVLFNAQLAEEKSRIIEDLDLAGQPYGLATLHRAENTDHPQRLRRIFEAFSFIAESWMPLVLPLHPRTRKRVTEAGLDISAQGIKVIDPVGYLDMMRLERNARVILTDSGGVQKEAYFMKVPCITLRDETEWTETVALGWNALTGADADKITAAFERSRDTIAGSPPFDAGSGSTVLDEAPYGDGRAAAKIVDILAGLKTGPASQAERLI